MSRSQALAIGAAAVAGVQVGAAMTASRIVIHDIGAASLALLRYAIAVLCLVPFVIAGGWVRFTARDLVAVMGLGIVQFGVLIALLNVGLRFMPSTRAALLFAAFPLLTMIMASCLGRERLGTGKTLGVAVAIAGVAAVLGENLLAESPETEWLGAAAVLAAASCGAICSVFYRPYVTRYPALPVGALAMVASVVVLAGLAAAEGFFADRPRLSAAGWAAVLFVGASSGAGYWLWLHAFKHLTPTRVTMFLSLSPLTAALLDVLLLGEPVTPGVVLGMVGVVGGLWIAMRAAV